MKRAGKCVNKKVYSYKSDALKVAHKVEKQTGKIYRVYECPTCLDFHLTTATNKEAARIRRRRRQQHRECVYRRAVPKLLDFLSNPQPSTFWSVIFGIISIKPEMRDFAQRVKSYRPV